MEDISTNYNSYFLDIQNENGNFNVICYIALSLTVDSGKLRHVCLSIIYKKAKIIFLYGKACEDAYMYLILWQVHVIGRGQTQDQIRYTHILTGVVSIGIYGNVM